MTHSRSSTVLLSIMTGTGDITITNYYPTISGARTTDIGLEPLESTAMINEHLIDYLSFAFCCNYSLPGVLGVLRLDSFSHSFGGHLLACFVSKPSFLYSVIKSRLSVYCLLVDEYLNTYLPGILFVHFILHVSSIDISLASWMLMLVSMELNCRDGVLECLYDYCVDVI